MNELISLKNMVTVLQTTLDNIGAYIYIKDLEGKYIFVNRLVKELFDAPLEEIIGFDDSKFFSLEKSDDLRVNDRLVMDQGQTIEKEEKNHVIKTGEIKYYWTVKKPRRDENGKITGMYGISTDITQTKKLENEVNQKNAELLRYPEIIHSDLNTAKNIQKNLLPKNLDLEAGLDISVRYHP
ncbi:MAG TPA: PAS domain-containing protein, partial [Leptospiraceae bacterium]|nr:PAS domain-containing protein [Leptospiraceae bacterium]